MKIRVYNLQNATELFSYISKDDDEKCEKCFITNNKQIQCHKNRKFVERFDKNKQLNFKFCINNPNYIKSKKNLNFFVSTFINIFLESKTIVDSILTEADEIILHNTKTIITDITSKFESIVEEEYLYGEEKIDYIMTVMNSDQKSFAKKFFSIYKSFKQLVNEYNIKDILERKKPFSDIDRNNAKIDTLLLKSFYLYEEEFKEKKIYMKIPPTKLRIYVNINAIQIAIAQFFNNCIKYCQRDKKIEIEYEEKEKNVIINFEMWSLYLKEDEFDEILKFRKRGTYAQKIEDNGEGLGMYITARLINLNNGKITFKNISKKTIISNIPYSLKKFSIILPKKNNN